jgi:hypothetical protein|tara:strand:- start:362 stop:529 length:168 start_codon:yes stop_codon:yes gene_type:complete
MTPVYKSSPYEYDEGDEKKSMKFKKAITARKTKNRVDAALRTKDVQYIMDMEDEI